MTPEALGGLIVGVLVGLVFCIVAVTAHALARRIAARIRHRRALRVAKAKAEAREAAREAAKRAEVDRQLAAFSAYMAARARHRRNTYKSEEECEREAFLETALVRFPVYSDSRAPMPGAPRPSWEERLAWKERNFALHYGAGPAILDRLREERERAAGLR